MSFLRKKAEVDESTFGEILKNIEEVQDMLKDLIFDDEDESAISETNDLLKEIDKFEGWYYNGGISLDED